MKESLKDVLLMGLGAISLTGEKANELKKELLQKGEILYKEGTIKNEELKRNIKEKLEKDLNENCSDNNMEENCTNITTDELVNIINNLSEEEKEKISKLLKNEE